MERLKRYPTPILIIGKDGNATLEYVTERFVQGIDKKAGNKRDPKSQISQRSCNIVNITQLITDCYKS